MLVLSLFLRLERVMLGFNYILIVSSWRAMCWSNYLPMAVRRSTRRWRTNGMPNSLKKRKVGVHCCFYQSACLWAAASRDVDIAECKVVACCVMHAAFPCMHPAHVRCPCFCLLSYVVECVQLMALQLSPFQTH